MGEDLYNDIAICAVLNDEEIEQIRDGRITEISVEINEENQYRLLESVDGHLVMTVDKMPSTDHSCFYYNHGIFPYKIKNTLKFIGVNGEHDTCFTKIIGMEVFPGTRFRYQGPDAPIVEDPNGDSCVWEVYLEVVPVLQDFRYILLRWDAADDSFTDEDLEEYMEDMEQGTFRMDWPVFDWQEVRRGDLFYMMRTDDDRAGIVFNGHILSDPYPVQSLSGKFDHEMCVDVICMNIVKPGDTPRISLKELKAAIPEFDWENFHSGEHLSSEIADKLVALWNPEEDDSELSDDTYVN